MREASYYFYLVQRIHMKKQLGLFLFLVSFSANTFAHTAPSRSNPILRFVAEIKLIREFALYTLIEQRCYRYMEKKDRNSCYQAIDQKITLLDFDLLLEKGKNTPVLLDQKNPGSFVFVAFKKDFLQLLSEQKTETYLELVNSEMTKYLVGQKKTAPNLWEMSLTFFGSEFEAARALAILFQDTSSVKLHLAYLEISGQQGTTSWFDSNRELLGRTIDTMNMVLDANGEDFQSLFYPRMVQAKLHRTIYHFYVPTYLSMALKRRGVPERFSFIAPLMMTLTYEFVTAATDFRYLWNDPTIVEEWSLGDIYGSYSGISFASGRINRVLSLDKLKASFKLSTAKGVEALIR